MKPASILIACGLVVTAVWLAAPNAGVEPDEVLALTRGAAEELSCEHILYQEEYELLTGAQCG